MKKYCLPVALCLIFPQKIILGEIFRIVAGYRDESMIAKEN